MIITRLRGGLGNQMFLYAAGKAFSIKLKTNLYLDASWFEKIKENKNIESRVYELDPFGIHPGKINIRKKINLMVHPATTLNDWGINYQKDFERIQGGNLFLDGYWQSFKYFENYQKEILKAFRFPRSNSNINKKLLDKINKTESVSIHVRRGDYALEKGKNAHGMLPLSYYEQAGLFMKKQISNPVFFVFSDEPEWCKKKLKFDPQMIFVDNNDTNNGVEDMRLLSACKYNIIANSSFSWWGAWLNININKVIVAPKNWFKDKLIDTSDLLPENWIRL
jgi:hypothetical protein